MPSDRYSHGAIALHWLMALLLIGMLVMGWTMAAEDLLPNSQRFPLYQLHKSFGITLLFLSLMRLIWRLTHRPPALPNTMKAWERMAAQTVHILFYVLMIAMPLSGWALVSASTLGIPTMVFGLFQWPHLPWLTNLPNQSAVADLTKEIHELFAYGLVALLALHLAAALKHHFIAKDGTLARMLPFLKS